MASFLTPKFTVHCKYSSLTVTFLCGAAQRSEFLPSHGSINPEHCRILPIQTGVREQGKQKKQILLKNLSGRCHESLPHFVGEN